MLDTEEPQSWVISMSYFNNQTHPRRLRPSAENLFRMHKQACFWWRRVAGRQPGYKRDPRAATPLEEHIYNSALFYKPRNRSGANEGKPRIWVLWS